MTDTLENYLKAIFLLCYTDEKDVVKVSDISKRLDISVPAVTDMIRKLQSEGFVTNIPYKGVSLTDKGEALGQKMVRRHRLWEAYLHQELGIPWDKVHDEAERLEHACSDMLIDVIDRKLNFPKTDPHGNPIPQQNGTFPALEKDRPLSECDPGFKGVITRVVDSDQDFLVYMNELGISLGDYISVKSVLNFDQSRVCVLQNGKECSLSQRAADHLFLRSAAF